LVSGVRRDAGMKSKDIVGPFFQRHDRFGRGGSSRSQPPRLSLESSTFNIKAFVEASREIYQDWKSLYTALSNNAKMNGNAAAKAHVRSALSDLENEFDDLAERCLWKKKIYKLQFSTRILVFTCSFLLPPFFSLKVYYTSRSVKKTFLGNKDSSDFYGISYEKWKLFNGVLRQDGNERAQCT